MEDCLIRGGSRGGKIRLVGESEELSTSDLIKVDASGGVGVEAVRTREGRNASSGSCATGVTGRDAEDYSLGFRGKLIPNGSGFIIKLAPFFVGHLGGRREEVLYLPD